jgi:hypothetical protein
MRSMRSSGCGWRPAPAFGYTGSIRLVNLSHGITCSISARNASRRVVRFLPFHASEENVVCFIGLSVPPIMSPALIIGQLLELVQRFPSFDRRYSDLE